MQAPQTILKVANYMILSKVSMILCFHDFNLIIMPHYTNRLKIIWAFNCVIIYPLQMIRDADEFNLWMIFMHAIRKLSLVLHFSLYSAGILE